MKVRSPERMKKTISFFFTIILFIVPMSFCSAQSSDGVINGSEKVKCNALTDDYKFARNEAFKASRSAYTECRESTSLAIHWKARAKCVKEFASDDGKVSSRCSHVAGGNESDLKHCDIFKPSKKQILDYIQEVVNERKITKCVG